MGTESCGGPVTIRPASVDDYPAFARLFPELGVDDPLPGLAAWVASYVPGTRVAIAGTEVLGYCYAEAYTDTGYVRNIVVAPHARRRGVARALMEETARRLRAAGKTAWRLNVAPTNAGALVLYESLGLRTLYASRAVRLPWTSAAALPRAVAAVVELAAARDAAVEGQLTLPRGQLAAARAMGRRVLGVATDGDPERCLGLAVFSAAFPGAFPFRAPDHAVVRPLVEAMRPHVVGHPHLNLVVDDDEPLVRRLLAAGGEARGEFLHLAGPILPPPAGR